MARLEIPIPDKVVGKLEVIENPDVIINKLKSIRDQVQKLSVDTDEIRRKIEEKQGTLALLEPFKDLQYDLSALRNRRYLYSILGIMPTSRIERFKQSLSQIPFVLIEEPQSDKKSQVLLLGPRNQRDFMILTARSAYVEALDIPDDVKGSLPEVIKMYEQEVDKLKAELVVLEQHKWCSTNDKKTGFIRTWYYQGHYSSSCACYRIYLLLGDLLARFSCGRVGPANKQIDLS